MRSGRKLRIALDCRIDDPRQGNGSSTLSLAHALSQSDTADQEYTFIVYSDLEDWLAPHIFGACRLVGIPRSAVLARKQILRAIPLLRSLRKRLPRKPGGVPVSDGYVESQKFDLVHFPTQIGYLTALPTIYQPWDLQHLRYPDFFTASDVLERERRYRTLCNQARYVCVQTEWCKKDVIDQYKIAPAQMVVIPWGSVLETYAPPSEKVVRAATEKFHLPKEFFFYPAVTWPHKNHSLICRALHRMKSEQGRTVHVYCTGTATPYRKDLDSLAQRLGVRDQLHFLGFVTPGELQAIYRTATAMIFPSKFEGFGLPILEAFSARLPVLCAHATVLPEVAKEAALYFDPDSPEELADRMRSALDDLQLRRDLVCKGESVLRQRSMRDTAHDFQCLYERIGLES